MKIFKVKGSDKRKEILATKTSFSAQSTGGADVDYFSPETGFVLLEKDRTYSPENIGVQRVKAICDLSLNNPPMGLRDGYYTIRQSPNLIKPFHTTANIYQAFLQSINDLEILADVDRDVFVEGRTPKGMIYYPFHTIYGNIHKPIGFTENIAKHVLQSQEISNCKNIIAIEKLASAVPLADSKFPKLTNSLLVTTGGFYTRGIATLIQRFLTDKNTWLWTDGDTWGVYMREVIKLGSMNSRHLDDKIRSPNVINAGLFPYVGYILQLPNDIDEKRPLARPESRKRIELLQKIGFPKEDVETFQKNFTYELEALNIAFRDRNNNPIGQALYLSKLMELTDRAIKPIPVWDTPWLQTHVKTDMEESVKQKLYGAINFDMELKDTITKAVMDKINQLTSETLAKSLKPVQAKLNLTDPQIKSLIYEWYVGHMEKEVIPDDTITKKAFDVKISGIPESTIQKKVDAFKKQLFTMVTDLLAELKLQVTVSPQTIPLSTTTKQELYNQVYRELKIKPQDEQKMESALKKYLKV